jgi:hypothetical protein
MDLLFNQETKFYNSTLADLGKSYHLLTYNIRQSMIKLPTHSGLHDLFFNYSTWIVSSPAAVALLYHVMQLTWFLSCRSHGSFI